MTSSDSAPPDHRPPAAIFDSELWSILLLAGGTVLLWGFRYLPMQDLPNHVAVSDYTMRLWRGEPEAARFYQLQLFAPTYRLYYILAAPLSATLGALTAARVMITLMWIGYVGACRALVRASRLQPWTVLALGPWFFSIQFFLGLLPSLLSSVFVLWSVWALLRLAQTQQRKWAALATLLGALAVATHVIVVVLWLAALVAYATPEMRRRWRQAALMAGVSLLPGLIWLPLRMAEQSIGLRALLRSLRYLEPSQYASRLLVGSILDEWAVDVGRNALIAGALALIGLLLWRILREPDRRPHVLPAAAICGAWWLALLATPNHSSLGGVWSINVRYAESAVLVTVLLAAHGLHRAPARIERFAFVVVALAVLLQGAGLYRAFARVDRAYRPIEQICAAVPFGATLTTNHVLRSAFDTGLPLAYHAHGYCSVGTAAFDAAVFQLPHMPVRATPPAAFERAPSPELGPYDFLIYDSEAPYSAPPADGALVVESGRWRLYRRREPASEPDAQ